MNALTRGPCRPFPWRLLDSTTREECAALRNVHRFAEQHARLNTFEGIAQTLLGSRVEILVHRVRRLSAARGSQTDVAVGLSRAHTTPSRGILLELDAALTATVVARVLNRATPLVSNGLPAPSADIAGALAAVVMAGARRAHGEEALRLFAAGPAPALEAALERAEPDLVAVTMTVLVGDEAFAARAVMSKNAAAMAPAPAWSTRVLAGLGAVPLTMPVVASATHASVADVAALRSGDVFLPGTWRLARAGARGSWVGPVALAAPLSETGVRAELGEGARIVLRGELSSLCVREVEMNEGESDALLETVGEVPVIVRVEIGEATMAARDWAALRRGDVIALGRRVGEHVVLRVGGVAVARGELVEVDGEVGVRIAERIREELTATCV